MPGVIFYAPILFYANVTAIYRPQADATGRIKYSPHGTALGTIYMNPKTFPADVFRQPVKQWAPQDAEFVLQMMKYRPVVVISPERANTTQCLVVPMYTLYDDQKKFTEPQVDQLKAQGFTSYVFIPEEPGTQIHNSFLDLARIQPISNNDMDLPRTPCRLNATGLALIRRKLTQDFLFT